MSDLRIGKVAYPDTYRVSASTDPSVRAVAPVVNRNQEALTALQEKVAELEERLEALEGRR